MHKKTDSLKARVGDKQVIAFNKMEITLRELGTT